MCKICMTQKECNCKCYRAEFKYAGKEIVAWYCEDCDHELVVALKT